MKILLIKTMADGHPYSHFLRSLQRALSDLGHEAVASDQSIHVVNIFRNSYVSSIRRAI